MASSFSFNVAVAVLLVLVHQHAAGEPENFDLVKAVQRDVDRTAKRFKLNVLWWDMSNERQEVKRKFSDIPPTIVQVRLCHVLPEFVVSTSNPQEKDYEAFSSKRVTAKAGNVEYGAEKSSAKRPSIAYIQWIHNGHRSMPQKVAFEKMIERKNTATWHVEAGFSYSGSLTAIASIPFVTFETKHQISLDLKGRHVTIVSGTEKFSVKMEVTVPPMKDFKIEWIITDIEKEFFWTSPVTVTGSFFLKYRLRHTGEEFLSFSSLNFLNKDDRFKQTGNNTYLYIAEGTFTVVKPQQSDVRVTEYDFHPYGGRSSAVRTYTIPLGLTPYTPTAKTP